MGLLQTLLWHASWNGTLPNSYNAALYGQHSHTAQEHVYEFEVTISSNCMRWIHGNYLQLVIVTHLHWLHVYTDYIAST